MKYIISHCEISEIKRILILAILFGILLLWISIIPKFGILNKILDLLDELMNRANNENGNAMKDELFS